MTDEASTTTWETIVEQYKERAVRDGARIDELRQSTQHWHDTAQMLKRQRDTAEEERDWWKLRAMKAGQERKALREVCESFRAECGALRDQLILAEGQRDQVKALVDGIRDDCKKLIRRAGDAEEDAEHWKAEWALVMGQLSGARAECEALLVVNGDLARDNETLEAECEALRKDAALLDWLDTKRGPHSRRPMRAVIGSEWWFCFMHPATHTPTLREALTAALAVQSTTGESK